MIKLTFCLRRRSDVTREEFQTYWRDRHAPLVRSVAHLIGARRYVQSHTVSLPELQAVVDARGVGVEPYDGVAELWWDDFEAMAAAGKTKEGRDAGRMLLADEANFIDLPNCAMFFSEEFEVISPE